MMGPIVGGFLTVWIDIRGLFLVTAGLLLFGAWWIRTGLNRSISPKRDQSLPQEKVRSAHEAG
jgi:DHA1 family multidrug resistance protein-like MFS transporter